MKAAERTNDEKHLYREEKYASIYEINMLRCIFCGLCEEACPKDAIYLTTSKVLVPSASETRRFYFRKRQIGNAVGHCDEKFSTSKSELNEQHF